MGGPNRRSRCARDSPGGERGWMGGGTERMPTRTWEKPGGSLGKWPESLQDPDPTRPRMERRRKHRPSSPLGWKKWWKKDSGANRPRRGWIENKVGPLHPTHWTFEGNDSRSNRRTLLSTNPKLKPSPFPSRRSNQDPGAKISLGRLDTGPIRGT